MSTHKPRHAKPLTMLAIEAELEAWAAAGFPLPEDDK